MPFPGHLNFPSMTPPALLPSGIHLTNLARGVLLLGFLMCTAWLAAQTTIPLKPGDVVAIAGDAGRFSDVAVYLAASQPTENVNVLIFGDRGATTQELLSKTMEQMLFVHPAVVVLCYGLKDANLQKSSPLVLEEYRARLTKAVHLLKKNGVREILITSPTALDPDVYRMAPKPLNFEEYSATLTDFSTAARMVAEMEKVHFVDLYTPMAAVIEKAKAKFGPTYKMTNADMIYPSSNSEIVLAHALLQAFGFNGNIGTIELDMRSGTATATAGQKIISADKNKVEIESTISPFCFGNKPLDIQDGNDPRSGLAFVPFNQDLNRYLLIVKNPPAEDLQVTWGAFSKNFTSEQLKKGVNLAAEFPQNPFCPSLELLTNKTISQRTLQDRSVGRLLDTARDVEKRIPNSQEAVAAFRRTVIQQSEMTNRPDPRGPLLHTISLSPVNAP